MGRKMSNKDEKLRTAATPPPRPLNVLLLLALVTLVFAPVVESHGSSIKALVKARVIPDVIDLFVPSAELEVSYGGKRIVNGLLIPPAAAAKAPSVRIIARRRSPIALYTLIVADPDAPSPDNPTRKEILHWLVVNIPGGRGLAKGEELVTYVGPAPPLGVHRYVFSLYRQKAALKGVAVPTERPLFSTRRFAAANKLGPPVAALYFNSTKETGA